MCERRMYCAVLLLHPLILIKLALSQHSVVRGPPDYEGVRLRLLRIGVRPGAWECLQQQPQRLHTHAFESMFGWMNRCVELQVRRGYDAWVAVWLM